MALVQFLILVVLVFIIVVPVIPVLLFICHILVLLRATEKSGPRAVGIWLGVFVLLSISPFVLPAQGGQGQGAIGAAPYGEDGRDVEMEWFLFGQTVLNLVGAVGWSLALCAGKAMAKEEEEEESEEEAGGSGE